MARKTGDNERGKLGNKILYMWNGRQCERSMPESVYNPKTEAQQAHRNAFSLISKLSSYMKDAHLVGLHFQAVREKNSTYAIFKHQNKDCFTSDGQIDYPRVAVSYGSVPKASITSARIDDDVLTVTFDSRYYAGDPTDEFYLFVYCPALCVGHLAAPVPRTAGAVIVQLPIDFRDHPIILYAFFRDTKGYTSDTIYFPLE